MTPSDGSVPGTGFDPDGILRAVIRAPPMLSIDVGDDFAENVRDVWRTMNAKVPKDPDFDVGVWRFADVPDLMAVARVPGYPDVRIVYDSRNIITWGEESGLRTVLYLTVGSDWYHIHDVKTDGGVLMLEIEPDSIPGVGDTLGRIASEHNMERSPGGGCDETKTRELTELVLGLGFVRELVEDHIRDDSSRGMSRDDIVADTARRLERLFANNCDMMYDVLEPRPGVLNPRTFFTSEVDWKQVTAAVFDGMGSEGVGA